MRLIDADAFERAVMFSDDEDLQDVIYRLRDFPTTDVVEVKRGKWKVAMLDHESMGCRPKVHYCSVCNHITTFRTFFCPNCGAKMDGKEADHAQLD